MNYQTLVKRYKQLIWQQQNAPQSDTLGKLKAVSEKIKEFEKAISIKTRPTGNYK